jgi:hypothetical protein
MHARILRPSFTPPVKTHKYFFANTVLTSTVTPLLLPTDHGRADIRIALGDGELYVLSKSDGMIRKIAAVVTPPPK